MKVLLSGLNDSCAKAFIVNVNPCKAESSLGCDVVKKHASVYIVLIRNGRDERNQDGVTIVDVACEASVSYTTISRVLSKKQTSSLKRASEFCLP